MEFLGNRLDTIYCLHGTRKHAKGLTQIRSNTFSRPPNFPNNATIQVYQSQALKHTCATIHANQLELAQEIGLAMQDHQTIRNLAWSPKWIDTYSPTAGTNSGRIMDALACLHSWRLWQADIANAFCQAFVDVPVYFDMPKGFGGIELLNYVKQNFLSWDKVLLFLGTVPI